MHLLYRKRQNHRQWHFRDIKLLFTVNVQYQTRASLCLRVKRLASHASKSRTFNRSDLWAVEMHSVLMPLPCLKATNKSPGRNIFLQAGGTLQRRQQDGVVRPKISSEKNLTQDVRIIFWWCCVMFTSTRQTIELTDVDQT
jgi:hypothetical protein